MPVISIPTHWSTSIAQYGSTIGLEWPNISHATVAGIAVAISGNVLISLALNCQKLAHRRLEAEREAAAKSAATEPSTTRSEISGDGYFAATRHLNGSELPHLISETEPLLSPSTPGLEHTSNPRREVKRSFLSRLWRGRATRAARESDHAHVAATHVMMPVDVVTVNRTSRSNGRSHDPKPDSDQDSYDGNESDYLKSKLWWLGFILMNIGEMGNFISYAFAPASLVAPLGTFALIANCFFAPLMLGERFRKRDFFGIIIAIIGAITVVLSTNPSDTRLSPKALIEAISRRPFVIYSTVYAVGIVILSGLSEGRFGKRVVYVDVGLCALFGGFTVLSTKAVSTLLTMEWFEMFTEWITYPVLAILIGTGVGQIRYLNRALMRFDSKIVVPTQFVLFNLSAILGSAIPLRRLQKATFHQLITFLYGCGATFFGVFLITWNPSSSSSTQEAPEQHTETEPSDASLTDSSTDPRNHNVRLGSISRRNRAMLVIPEGTVSSSASPRLARKQSIVSMLGFSSAQRVLIVHTPPRDGFCTIDVSRTSRVRTILLPCLLLMPSLGGEL
ncbi:hypothetical protein QCA50_000203 [Cerrena zonata]|uniref:DUF803-domain-containing protein n=1 Tax=Cerrena zonata TaxID=2478898 RepID=A0AAW0GU10_9APHY